MKKIMPKTTTIFPYDVYERHKKIATYLKSDDTVLDIGGELNHLSQFAKTKKIVVANLTSGDVIISQDKLPFEDNSFDIVCAIDVLEHIPKDKRKGFIEKIVNIAIKKTIISFPIGTSQHNLYEQNLEKWLEKKGNDISYLKEHIKYGLPSYNDILKLTSDYKKEIFFSGNLKVNSFLFKLFIYDPKIKYIRKLFYILKNPFYFIANPLLYFLLSNKTYKQNVNRAYVLIYKK